MSSSMDDAFTNAMDDVFKSAPAELIKSMEDRFSFIKTRYTHSEKSVLSCESAFRSKEKPTLLDVLVAAYVLNGGILLKHSFGQSIRELEDEAEEMDGFLKEMECMAADMGKPEYPADF